MLKPYSKARGFQPFPKYPRRPENNSLSLTKSSRYSVSLVLLRACPIEMKPSRFNFHLNHSMGLMRIRSVKFLARTGVHAGTHWLKTTGPQVTVVEIIIYAI